MSRACRICRSRPQVELQVRGHASLSSRGRLVELLDFALVDALCCQYGVTVVERVSLTPDVVCVFSANIDVELGM